MRDRYTQYNDKELLDSLRGKKPESDKAFTEIYKRYAQRVKAYCMVTLNDEEQAADIFQETFIRFYSKTRETKAADVINIPGFLITIARNLCLNYKRDKKNTVPIDELTSYFEADNSFEKNELWQLITMALDLMDTKYKDVFILRELDNFSIKEIADITGESVACVKSRVFRAHARLLEILEPYLNDMAESNKRIES